MAGRRWSARGAVGGPEMVVPLFDSFLARWGSTGVLWGLAGGRLGCSGTPPGLPNEPQGPPKASKASKMSPNALPRPPQGLQGLQNEPKCPPKASQMSPKASQMSPKDLLSASSPPSLKPPSGLGGCREAQTIYYMFLIRVGPRPLHEEL